MSQDWVTAFSGPMWEVVPLQSELEARDIPTFLPDENMKGIDPFITGVNALQVQLMVPRDLLEMALEIIREPAEALTPSPPPASRKPKAKRMEDTVLSHLDVLGRRIRWGAILFFTAPVALYVLMDYLALMRKHGVRPDLHGYTLAAGWLAGLWVVLLVLLLTPFVFAIFGS